MRLWYQSMTRATSWLGYNARLKEVLADVGDEGTQIDVHGITRVGGAGDQYRYLEFLETAEVLENVHRAMREGYDAFLIGNIADPGLREAREFADIPVLGLCECSLHTACLMGGSFSLVTINEKFTPRIVENVGRYGLKERFAGVARMKVNRLLDLEEGFNDPEARDRILAAFNQAARANTRDGAEVVVAAGGVVMALLAAAGIHQTEDGTPILNGIINLVAMAEAVVKMNRIMDGQFMSRRLMYAPPPPDQIAELRKYYGPGIYPTVAEPDDEGHRT